MAKDPAFLFYPNDYMGGTMGMSFEEKGAYMDLLVMQFNKGAFSIDQAKKVLNGSFERLWPELKEKFEETDGKFFNERLESEKSRRKNFIEKQSINGKRGGRGKEEPKSNPTVNPTVSHGLTNIETENENENTTEVDTGNNGSAEGNVLQKMFTVWKKHKPNYPGDWYKDAPALRSISKFICKQSGVSYQPQDSDVQKTILELWEAMSAFISQENFINAYSLSQVDKHLQSIIQKIQNGQRDTKKPGSKVNIAEALAAAAQFHR